MIKLKQLIPEIKIQPNTRPITIGDKFYDIAKPKVIWTVTHFGTDMDGDREFKLVFYKTNKGGIYMVEEDWMVDGLKDGILKPYKKISEVKIQPNIKVDTTDKFLFFVERNKKEIIGELRDNLEKRYGEDYGNIDWEDGYVKKKKDMIYIEDSDGMNNLELSIYRFDDYMGYIIIKGVTIYFSF